MKTFQRNTNCLSAACLFVGVNLAALQAFTANLPSLEEVAFLSKQEITLFFLIENVSS